MREGKNSENIKEREERKVGDKGRRQLKEGRQKGGYKNMTKAVRMLQKRREKGTNQGRVQKKGRE